MNQFFEMRIRAIPEKSMKNTSIEIFSLSQDHLCNTRQYSVFNLAFTEGPLFQPGAEPALASDEHRLVHGLHEERRDARIRRERRRVLPSTKETRPE